MRIFKILLVLQLVFQLHIFAGELSFGDSFKSKIIERAVAVYFLMKGYGTVKKIEINSANKTIAINLMPEGEKDELNIFIGSYSLAAKEQKVYLTLNKITTNRIWLNRIFADHMPQGINIPLDESAGTVGRAVF